MEGKSNKYVVYNSNKYVVVDSENVYEFMEFDGYVPT